MRLRRRASVHVAVVAGLLLAPIEARAEPSKDRAKEYFDAGTQAYESGRYVVALRAYEEAYAAMPSAETTFSMAQAARLGFFEKREPALLDRALVLYKRYLEEAPDGRRRAHAIQHIAGLEALLALGQRSEEARPAPPPPETMLLIVSRTPGASASIDGDAAVPVPVAREVAPGPHRVEVVAPGHEPESADWPAVEGRLVVVPVALKQLPASVRVSAPAGAGVYLDGREVGEGSLVLRIDAGPHVVRVTERGYEPLEQRLASAPGASLDVDAKHLEPTPWRQASRWLFGGAGALGVAAIVTGGVAFAAEEAALEQEERIGREPLGDAYIEDHQSTVKLRDDARTVAITLGIGGAVLAGAGFVIHLADVPQERGEARSEIKVQLSAGGIAWRVTY